jgi:hypothetical protein
MPPLKSDPPLDAREPVALLNPEEARFECTFGRGCTGLCCQNSRPPVSAQEARRIAANLPKFLPELRAEARRLVERMGFLGRRKAGQPALRVEGGWCVFFNQGCVLHKIGAGEGDKLRYKPAVCALFPLDKDKHDRWYVRQKGFKGERWDLFCLDPKTSGVRAVESLREEIALAARVAAEE